MVDWYLGTIGFSYKDWEGIFYPAGLPARSYLAYYSEIFNAVELDSTFYGTPPTDRVTQWSSATPPNFKFCVKTPRQITHDLRLVQAKKAMADFIDTISLFDDKLGAVLIQLPPSLTSAQIDTVSAFLAELPGGFRYAVEFRHHSWFTAGTAALLETYRIGWVSVDYVGLPKQITQTADFLYLRWLGRHGQFKRHDQEQQDVTAQLEYWVAELQPYLDRAETIYGFFNNDYAGHSPATSNQFKQLIGLPVNSPQTPQQERLF